MNRRKKAVEDVGFFDELQLTGILMDLWQAGYETLVTTLSWAIVLMVKYPDIQKMVQNEIDLTIGHERLPNMNDRNNLPYTNAVLHEVQRYANIAAFGFGRMAKKGTNVNGFVMPEDMPLLPAFMAVLTDERYFENADQFNPERFLENGNFKKVDQSVPFSLGKRSCIGESLAKMELFLIFASFLQKFSFSAKFEPSLEPLTGIVMKPQPYECTITVRH